MKNKKKKTVEFYGENSSNAGITLIALIVTIIVILILAGVAISLTVNDKGVFSKSEKAAQAYKTASEDERQKIDNLANYIDEQSGTKYAVELDGNGGESKKVYFPAGKTVEDLPSSTRLGYNFLGWFTEKDGGTSIEGQTIRSDLKAYAHWEIISYSITYDLAGGTTTASLPTTYTIEDNITLENPTKEYYKFTGWTENDDNTLKKDLKISDGKIGDLNLTANYSAIEISEITKNTPLGTYVNYECSGGRHLAIILYRYRQ